MGTKIPLPFLGDSVDTSDLGGSAGTIVLGGLGLTLVIIIAFFSRSAAMGAIGRMENMPVLSQVAQQNSETAGTPAVGP